MTRQYEVLEVIVVGTAETSSRGTISSDRGSYAIRGSRRVPFLSSSVGLVSKPSPDERSPDKQPGDKRHVSVARDIRRWTVMDGGRIVGEENDGREMRTRGVRTVSR